MTISIPLTLCRLVSETGRPNLQLKNGSFVFKGEINAPYRLVFGGSEIGDAWFGRVSGTGYFQPAAAFQKTSHLYFTDQVSMGAFYAYNNKSTWVLRCPNGVTGDVTIYASPFVCETNDVFAAMSNKGFPWASHNSTDGGRIDLNGFDQNFPNEQNGCFVCRNTAPVGQPITNYGFTSPADRPANVILSGAGVVNAAKSQRYNGHFYGSAGLVWDPSDAEAEFVFSNVVHDTTGELVVSNGIVRLFDGASFTALSKLTVASGATLKADDSYDATSGHATGADFFAQEIKVAADAKLDLPRDVTLVTKKFAVGDEVVTAVGKYTRADYPALFTGDGTVEIKGVPCSFTGPSGGLWSDPDNWEGGALPDEQSAVIIPAGKSVVIDETNAEVYSVAIGGGNSAATLTMTNWNTCLQAKYINVLNKGVITTTDAFTNETQKCRVWIKCIDFNLASGASIAMDGKGWMGGHYNLTNPDDPNPSGAWYNDDGVNHGGWGPGRTKAINAGASHLGLGGNSFFNRFTPLMGSVYDNPYAPVEPGSGGYGLTSSAYGQAYKAIGSGGGAVRIEATGDVVIDGTVSANGKSSSAHSQYNGLDLNYRDDNNQAGSGGSVWITCSRFSGSGEIHADGGNGGWGLGTSLMDPLGIDSTGMPGGGGGVAITYDTAKQQAGAAAGMKISAAAGVFISVENKTAVSTSGLTWTTVDDCFRSSEPGTLYFTDDKIVDDTLGKGLTGRLFALTNYTYEGDLDWTYGYVRFGATGAVFTVTGDLTLSGENARLDLGGNHICTNWTILAYVDAGDQPVKMNVGGDLTVSDGALLAVYAAQVADEATSWGAEVAVSGAFTVGAGGRVRPISNQGYGGAPRFTAGSFALEADGKVDAVGRGGAGGWTSSSFKWVETSHQSGIGKGATTEGYTGSSHGGEGGRSYADGAAVSAKAKPAACDDAYRPAFTGAGGGANGYDIGGNGGGVFHLTAAGPVRVDGEIDVSGMNNVTYGTVDYFHYYSSGAGGTIYLSGTTLSGASTARLRARGGNATTGKDGYISGGGAGGRIALWFGHDKELQAKYSQRHAATPGDPRLQGGFANWFGSVDVGGGTNAVPCNIKYTLTDQVEETWGGDGTVTYNGAFDPFGAILLVK